MDAELKDILKGKVVIVGVGNILRGDDGVGPVLIEKIKDNVKAVCIDAGNAPENYIGKIVKLNPDTILVVDAVHLDLESGKYEILKKNDINTIAVNTHNLSPDIFIGYLEKETNADIYVFGIQPEKTSFGEEMSKNVAKTLKQLADSLIGAI